MLRVTIEIVPWGFESLTRKVGVVQISNVGGSEEVGDYHVRADGDRDGQWQMLFDGDVNGIPRGDFVECVLACLEPMTKKPKPKAKKKTRKAKSTTQP